MKLADLKNKKILLLGYGKEGVATEAFLKNHFPDIRIGIADKKNDPAYLEKQKVYDIAIRSPGIPKQLVTIPYTTATNLFFEQVQGTTIGVTGTKGKSTTASLIYHLLKGAGLPVHLAGNIGKPMLESLMESNKPEDIFVVELSSYQLDDVAYSPHISVVIDLYPDHLDYHGSLEAYYEAKHTIIRYATPEDIFIYNPRFPQLQEWAQTALCKSKPYDETLSLSVDSHLMGEHNRQNIAAAITVAKEYAMTDEQIFEALKTFQPLPHRLQMVGEYHGITFYDDAISTTPESTIQAIETLSPIGTIMLGGQDRGYDFNELVKRTVAANIQQFILFPTSGETIRDMLKKAGITDDRLFLTDSMEKAVEYAFAHTPSGTICLLSTASPSYSLWKNFEEKGEQFQHWISLYAQKKSTTHQDNSGSGSLS